MSVLEVCRDEYRSLKDEQRDRIVKVRDAIPREMFTASAAVVAFAFSGSPPRYAALLVLPVVCFVLGWKHLMSDWKISEIGDYVREDLTKVIGLELGSSARVLAWETVHRFSRHRRRRKGIQLVVDLLMFCLPGVVAVIMYSALATHPPIVLILVSGVEAAGLVVLAMEIFIQVFDTDTSDI